MPTVPDEVVVAKLAIEAARVSLESLFEKLKVMPRSEKVIVNEKIHEACARLQAAQVLLQELETTALADDSSSTR